MEITGCAGHCLGRTLARAPRGLRAREAASLTRSVCGVRRPSSGQKRQTARRPRLLNRDRRAVTESCGLRHHLLSRWRVVHESCRPASKRPQWKDFSGRLRSPVCRLLVCVRPHALARVLPQFLSRIPRRFQRDPSGHPGGYSSKTANEQGARLPRDTTRRRTLRN